MEELTSVTRVYRPRAVYVLMGIVGLIFTFGPAIDRATIAVLNFDSTLNQSLCSALFWVAGTLSSLWCIVLYFRERLWLDDRTITHRGIVGTRSISRSEIQQIEWNSSFWFLAVTLRSPDRTLRIYPGMTQRDEELEIIAFLRLTFDRDCQRGWERFAKRFEKIDSLNRIEQIPRHQQESVQGFILFLMFGFCLLVFGQRGTWGEIAGGIASLIAAGYLGWKSATHKAKSSSTASGDVVTQTPRAASEPPG